MKAASFIRRWLTRRRLFAGPAVFVHRWGAREMQLRQRGATQAAFLSDQPNDRRPLYAPAYGDTQ